MKTLVVWLAAFTPFILHAQNVGIGTTTPLEKLEVRNSLRATVRVSSNNLSDTTELLLSNRIGNATGTDFSLKSIREEGLFIGSLSDWPAHISPHSLVIKPYGYTGINDPNPAARLTVSGNETSFNGFNAAIGLRNTASSNMWFIRTGGPGTATPNGGFSIADNAGYHFNIDGAGDIGIGMNPVGAKLHINGNVKVQGTQTVEFGAGIAGKEMNAGKIGYNAFGTSALAIVGAGTSAANRAVYFFAEGGTTFNGPVNIAGTIQVNGNPGVAGQVLSSNGTGDPVWRNTSFTNVTRFGVRVVENAAKSGTTSISGTYYNHDPANVVIGSSIITINKSGLYHFDIGATGSLNFSSSTSAVPTAGVWLFFGLANSLQVVNDKMMTPGSAANSYYNFSEKVSVEVYITAPASLSVYHTFNTLGVGGGSSTHNFSGFLTGHLIAE